MKSIISKKTSWLEETHRLLLDAHMNVRSSRSTETTLKILTKQIHIVWDQKTNRMIILLSLNVASAFDTMFHSRLIHNLRKKKISQWIIIWVSNFEQNRSITLNINRRVIESFALFTNIFQRSLILSLLYLFYNANLLECATDSTSTRDFSNTQMMSTYWHTIRVRRKTVEDSRKCTNFAKNERIDTSSSLFRSNMSWYNFREIQRSSTWQSLSTLSTMW
jgi:hypothetical protein